MIIGYIDKSYPNKRCIIGQTSHEYVQLKTNVVYRVNTFINRVIRFVLTRIGRKYNEWDRTSRIFECWYSNIKQVDLLHVFNYIPITSRNWVCTFESNTPVTDNTIGRQWEQGSTHTVDDRLSLVLLRRCAQENCRGLIAISESAYNIQINTIQNSNLDETTKQAIKNKIVVIQPPQDTIIQIDELHEKLSKKRECVHFLLIGHDFFRKGGLQVIEALEKLYGMGYRMQLTIVSKMVYGDYASMSGIDEYESIKRKINNYSWIEQYDQLTNAEVLKLAMRADVGLLPSLAETYGYSALELMACGCPVITTNIRAFREINDESRGWICNINPNQYGESIYANMNDSEKMKIMSDLQKALEVIFRRILDNPELITEKSKSAYYYIKENHSSEKYAELLSEVYEH